MRIYGWLESDQENLTNHFHLLTKRPLKSYGHCHLNWFKHGQAKIMSYQDSRNIYQFSVLWGLRHALRCQHAETSLWWFTSVLRKSWESGCRRMFSRLQWRGAKNYIFLRIQEDQHAYPRIFHQCPWIGTPLGSPLK